jgi:hypothetical protein
MLAKINPSTVNPTVLYTAPAGRRPQVTVNMANVSISPADVLIGIVSAEDRSISSVVVADGGAFATRPSLVIATTGAAPTTSAAAVIATMKLTADVAITAAGSGYAIGQILNVTGGTQTAPAQIRVDAIGVSGEVTAASISQAGIYSALPASPVATTGETGIGATFTPKWAIISATVSTSGNGYSPNLARTTISATGGGKTVDAVLTLQFSLSFEDLTDTFHPSTTLVSGMAVERSGIVLDPGDTVVVKSSVANAVNFFAMGYEDLA